MLYWAVTVTPTMGKDRSYHVVSIISTHKYIKQDASLASCNSRGRKLTLCLRAWFLLLKNKISFFRMTWFLKQDRSPVRFYVYTGILLIEC